MPLKGKSINSLSKAKKRIIAPRPPDKEMDSFVHLVVPQIIDAYKAGAAAARLGKGASGIGKLLGKIPSKLVEGLQPIFDSVEHTNDVAWGELLGVSIKEMGVSTKIFNRWVKENTSLITDLSEEMYGKAYDTVRQATKQGLHYTELTKQIQADLDVPKARARLIARDQTLKVNSQLTEASHASAGVTKFEWLTSGDSRVRERHAALSGKIFTYKNPPAIGLPGTDFQCRCIAFPVVDWLNEDSAGMVDTVALECYLREISKIRQAWIDSKEFLWK